MTCIGWENGEGKLLSEGNAGKGIQIDYQYNKKSDNLQRTGLMDQLVSYLKRLIFLFASKNTC